MEFNGTDWVSLGFPVPGPSAGILSGSVHALTEFEGKLFAGGIFSDFQDTIFGTSTASFDGTNWKAYPFDGNLGPIVYDFKILNGKLIAGGDFGYWQGSSIIASCVMLDSLSASHWTSLNFYNALVGGNLNVQDLAIVNDTFYACGRFDYAGSSSLPVHNVARFNGDLPTGITGPKAESSHRVFPNPATGIIYLNPDLFASQGSIPATVIDATGRMVLHDKIGRAGLDVSKLLPGIYTVIFEPGGVPATARFVRQ